MARILSFDQFGEIETDQPKVEKAIVRFPNDEEVARGITIIPREQRVREYKERAKEKRHK